MKLSTKLFFLGLLISSTVMAEPFYCPGGAQFINVGETQSNVLQACGEPQNIKKSKQAGTKRIPVTQMTFTVSTQSTGLTAGTRTPGVQSGAFYVNTGPTTTVVVSISDDVITGLSMNGTTAESISICDGSINVGDPGSSALNCGTPTAVNDTYKTINTDEVQEVETWSYNPGNYQPSFQLTFVNGELTKIQK